MQRNLARQRWLAGSTAPPRRPPATPADGDAASTGCACCRSSLLHLACLAVRLGRRERDRAWPWRWRCTRCACSRSRASTTATSRTARSAPRAPRSSCSRCSAPRPCSAARCGGRRIIATTTCTPTTRRTPFARCSTASLWSHMGWFMSRANFAPRSAAGRATWRAIPELRFLDRFDVARAAAARCRAVRARRDCSQRYAPALGTSGAQLLVWGFCISTVALYHAHLHASTRSPTASGGRRYDTRDDVAQQPVARAAHVRRGLAQQPPPLPGVGAPGLLLVGDRPHLLRPARCSPRSA